MQPKQHESVVLDGEVRAEATCKPTRFARGTTEEPAVATPLWHEALELETASDPVFVVEDNCIVALNERAESLIGLTKAELLGAELACVFRTTGDVPSLVATDTAVRFIGRGVELLHANGSVLPVEVVVFATNTGACVVLVRNAHASETLREEDMAEIVHDLKNPLSTIAIDAQALGFRQSAAATPSQVWRIERNVAYMDRLVQDLLDLCALDTGCLRIERRPVELRALLERVLDRVLPAHQRDRVYLDACEHVVVTCDEYRIERVVANLVENAIKYTPATGDIIVRLRTRFPITTVSVIDCGPGLSPSECECVFDKFKRASTGRCNGSGLGLYVSRKIIDAHGGRLGVESVPGLGSRFFFELPITRRGTHAEH
jgi:signal transduction histidine kinase